MKVVIAGSRSVKDYRQLLTALLHSNFEITEVVCGMAIGTDKLGEKWARVNNIPVKEMPADWNKHGKPAGPIRNRQMAEYADAAIVLWDAKSPGTLNMISEMNKLNKPIFVRVVT
jgi:predicted Rossmann fold nucleotide-binding protein DprA/Smf involved in DNA uptake